jgi:hypothetical protein
MDFTLQTSRGRIAVSAWRNKWVPDGLGPSLFDHVSISRSWLAIPYGIIARRMPRLDDGSDVARRSPAKRNMDAAGAGWQVIVSPATRTRVVFPFVARPSSKDGRARSRSPDLRGRKIRHVSDHVKSASHRSREPRQSPCVSATHVAIGESDHGRRSGRALGRSREDRPVAGAGDFSFLSSARPSPRPAPALLATPLVQYFSDRADSPRWCQVRPGNRDGGCAFWPVSTPIMRGIPALECRIRGLHFVWQASVPPGSRFRATCRHGNHAGQTADFALVYHTADGTHAQQNSNLCSNVSSGKNELPQRLQERN